MIPSGQLIILISPKGKRYTHKLAPGAEVHTQDGVISLDEAAEAGFGGSCAPTWQAVLILKPRLYDLSRGSSA
jgi:tRNA (adenine57-N1/adenine58-N1)-methyltransferase